MKCLIPLLLIAALSAGCNKATAPDTNQKPGPSTAETLIDGFTGRTAVKAGQKAKADITRISEKHNRDLEAIME